jgi:ABC-type glycerol-3-phosphate transport system permease component
MTVRELVTEAKVTREEAPAVIGRPYRRRVRAGTVVRHIVLAFFAFIVIFPIFWVVLLSLKSLPDAYQNEIWPQNFDFSHYSYSLRKIPTLPRNFANSVIVTTGTVVVTTISAVMAGYALVHLRTPGRAIVLAMLVASMFFPTRVTAIIAIWQIQKDLGLLNTTWGLILPYVTLNLALSVFIMRGMFESVPKELADAARIDGASPVRMLLSVMLPMVRNGIVVVIIVNFVSAWGEYLLAATLTNDQSVRTLPVVLASASGGMGAWAWPRIAAVYVMAITPGLVMFAIAQRWYMKGLSEGALKA